MSHFRTVGALVVVALAAGCATSKREAAEPLSNASASIALTFDEYDTTYSKAFPVMKGRGLVGTFFVNPALLERGILTAAQLREMQEHGWSIQAYSGTNMLTFRNANGLDATRARLIEIRDQMEGQGFSVTALAAGSRAWSEELRDVTVGLYETVRVARANEIFQQYPFPDPLYVEDGGTPSLSTADTIDSLATTLQRLQSKGGLWIVVVHKVGDDKEPALSIPLKTFEAFCDLISREVAGRRLSVITLR